MVMPPDSRPASLQEISGATAVLACAAMAVSYVAVLYAPTVVLRFPPLTSHRSFLHHRFACAAVTSAASTLATASLLRIQAVVIPLLLTALVYAGSFVARLWYLLSSWGRDGDETGIGCAQRLAHWIQAAADDVMVWRNYIVHT